MNFLFRQTKRLSHAFSGVWFALVHDQNYRLLCCGSAIFIGSFAYFFWPLDKIDWLFLGLAWTMLLITELQNSAFEHALDHLHPDAHDKIGRSKDMAAGSVLTAGLFLVFVLAVIAAL